MTFQVSPLVFILLQFLEITFFLKILGAKTPIESTLPRPLLVVTWASWVKVTKFDFQSLLRLFKFNFRYCELRRDYLFSSEVIPITFFLEVSLWYKTSKTFFFCRKICEDLKEKMAKLDGPCFFQVDAHNVVPVWETSDQQENTPRDIRKKIMCKLGQFLTEFPPVVKHPVDTAYPCKVRYFSLPFHLALKND